MPDAHEVSEAESTAPNEKVLLLLATTRRLPAYDSDVVMRAATMTVCSPVEVFLAGSLTVQVTRVLPIGRTAGASLVTVSAEASSKPSLAVTPAAVAVSPW